MIRVSKGGINMGIFNLFKKEKSDVEKYYEERNKRANSNPNLYAEETEGIENFMFTVQDVFSITGRGTVVTGMVEAGTISVNDKVTIKRKDGTYREAVVTGIEMFRKIVNVSSKGDNVGILLKGVERNDVKRGDMLLK